MGARDGAGQSCVQTGPNVFTDLHGEHGGRFVVLVEKESHSLLCSPMRDPPGGVIESIRGERLDEADGGSRLVLGPLH